MRAIVVFAATSLLALATPAFAQNPAAHRHFERSHPHARYRVSVAHRSRPRYGSGDVYVTEGRASAPEVALPAFGWRPEVEEEGVGADLIGPGSVGETPTGQHDVSR